MSPSDGPVGVEVAGGVATVTLRRPEVRNAIDDAMRHALVRALEAVTRDDSVRVVVLTGEGSAFCAGGDVTAMQRRLSSSIGRVAFDGWRRQRGTAAMIAMLHDAAPVTIAAVNGPAMGLGMDIALACDFIVAAPEARFGAAFVKRGLIPDGGGMYFLPRRIGLQRTKELIYSGRAVDADEALAIGLADRLAASGALLDEVRAFAEPIVAHSASALALMKSIVNRTFESTLADVASLGAGAQAISYTTDDHRFAVEAFLGR